MQKPLLALLTGALLLVGSAADAQTVFAPLGAEWWYQWGGLIIPPVPYTHVSMVGDSIVGGQLAHKLLEEFMVDTGAGYYPTHTTTYFVRTSGDDVLSWDPAAGAYRLEYRFNRAAGDAWQLPGCTSGSSIGFVVDSVVLVTSGNAVLRQQYSSRSGVAGGGRIALERVGQSYGLNSPLMFPRPWCMGGPAEAVAELVSYTDSTVRIGTVPVLALAEPLPIARLTLSPNPSATGRFRCEGLPAETISYEVVDAVGRTVSRGQLTAATPNIDLSKQPAGLYLLRGAWRGLPFTRRLVRE